VSRKRLERFDYEHRWDVLARYNSERARGIMHSLEWQEHMRREQVLFDEEQGPRPSRPDPSEPVKKGA
jgi:hypothetical protein